jgi:hypothetical protein
VRVLSEGLHATREALQIDELPEEQTELVRLWQDLRHAADGDGPPLNAEVLVSLDRRLADVAAVNGSSPAFVVQDEKVVVVLNSFSLAGPVYGSSSLSRPSR